MQKYTQEPKSKPTANATE